MVERKGKVKSEKGKGKNLLPLVSFIYYLSSVICYLSSIIYYLSSVICYLLSIMGKNPKNVKIFRNIFAVFATD